ncbi:MAG: thiamine phosphate synthase [Deferribacteraceae bacterium]|jgi:thiamine-phosphate pyrophosphorylase|nr:thiamine phosphate synthase [Deferribacteraceae bacterium]
MKILLILDHDRFKDDYLSIAQDAAPHVDLLWYRIKGVPDCEIYKRAIALRTALPHATLILSERADIATAANFQGVHLNANTPPPAVIKGAFPELLVGYSAHSVEECRIAADYITLSPIFHTAKPYEVHPLGVIPAPAANVYALGGVSASNINLLKSCGYLGVAGISLYNELPFS